MLPTLKIILAYARTLPVFLMVKLTGKERRQREIYWRSDSLVHNLFMIWMAIFWERSGIRFHTNARFDPDTGLTTIFHGSWESLLFSIEEEIKQFFKRGIRIPVRVHVPMLQLSNGQRMLAGLPYLMAVAYDNEQGTSGTSPSMSFTRGTGSTNYAGFVFVDPFGPSRSSSATTWAGNSLLSQVIFSALNGTANVNGNNGLFYEYYAIESQMPSGAQTVASTTTASYGLDALTFSGVNQTNPMDPDFGGTGVPYTTQTYGSITNAARTFNTGTTHVDQSVGVCNSNSEGINPSTGGANTTYNILIQFLGFNTAPVSIGTVSLIFNFVGTSPSAFFQGFAVQPFTAAGPANMKTWDGLAKASINTMEGLAIASVKSYNGLT